MRKGIGEKEIEMEKMSKEPGMKEMLMFLAAVLPIAFLLFMRQLTGNTAYLDAALIYIGYWVSYVFVPFSLGFSLIGTLLLIPLRFIEIMYSISWQMGAIGIVIAIGMVATAVMVLKNIDF